MKSLFFTNFFSAHEILHNLPRKDAFYLWHNICLFFAFGGTPKNSFPAYMDVKKSSPVFPSKSFIFSGLSFNTY